MIPPQEFELLLQELQRQPISENKYRDQSGAGQQQFYWQTLGNT